MARLLTSGRLTPSPAWAATCLLVLRLAWSAVLPGLHAQAPEQEQVINLIKARISR